MHDVAQRSDCLGAEECRGDEDLQKSILCEYSTRDEMSDKSPFPPAYDDGPFTAISDATTYLPDLLPPCVAMYQTFEFDPSQHRHAFTKSQCKLKFNHEFSNFSYRRSIPIPYYVES